MALLVVENFSCGYGEMVAVRDLSFTIEPGQILALLGPNGAGKTSNMLAIMGHVPINAGSLLATAPITYLVNNRQYVTMPSGGAILTLALP